MANPVFIKAMNAEAAIAAFRIVKIGAADGGVIQGAAAADVLLGVSDELGQATAADRVDVILTGIADVLYGGTVARGARLTSDATGRAVAAAPVDRSSRHDRSARNAFGVQRRRLNIWDRGGQIPG